MIWHTGTSGWERYDVRKILAFKRIKESLTRDFRLQVIFHKSVSPGPWVSHWDRFDFLYFRNLTSQFIAGVVDTADKHSFTNISANFRKKSKRSLMIYSGARRTLIHEKKLKSKISCQTPFKGWRKQLHWKNLWILLNYFKGSKDLLNLFKDGVKRLTDMSARVGHRADRYIYKE